MRNFYNTCKFSALAINFSEVWPRQIRDLGKQFKLMIHLETFLKTFLQDALKVSSRCLEVGDVLKMSWRRFCKTSWRRLENVLKTSWQDDLKTSWRFLEDLWPRRIYWSWSRRHEDVFWRWREKTSSSRRMFAGILCCSILLLYHYFMLYSFHVALFNVALV